MDNIDRKILKILQEDATISMDALAEKVNLSRNACWRRTKVLEDMGVITGRVALLDPERLDLSLQVLVLMRTATHTPDWLDQLERVVKDTPEILSAYRMSGDLDYVLRVRVRDVKDYDRFYQDLIRRIPISDISSSFVMEELKQTTALPV